MRYVVVIALSSFLPLSTFRVTTPLKPSRSEMDSSEGDDSDTSSGSSTPNTSPKEGKKEFEYEEEKFLKTNFESLSAEQVEQFFNSQPLDPHSVRLSISTQFLSRSWR